VAYYMNDIGTKDVWIFSDRSKWLYDSLNYNISLTLNKSLLYTNIEHSNIITDVLFCLLLWLATSN